MNFDQNEDMAALRENELPAISCLRHCSPEDSSIAGALSVNQTFGFLEHHPANEIRNVVNA